MVWVFRGGNWALFKLGQTGKEAELLVEQTGYDMVRLRSAHAVPGWEVRPFPSNVRGVHLAGSEL